MKRCKPCGASLGVVCLLLISAEITRAQSADRILTFQSEITVARDRTLTVSETFWNPPALVVNDTGVFNDGFHRRLWIKNHPLLFPWLAFLSGLIVFTTTGFAVARPVLQVFGYQDGPTNHQIAVTVAVAATVLSTVSLFVFREPYTAMPGFLLGAIISIGISGSPHGGEPVTWAIVGAASNLVIYYLVAVASDGFGHGRIWRLRRDRWRLFLSRPAQLLINRIRGNLGTGPHMDGLRNFPGPYVSSVIATRTRALRLA